MGIAFDLLFLLLFIYCNKYELHSYKNSVKIVYVVVLYNLV